MLPPFFMPAGQKTAARLPVQGVLCTARGRPPFCEQKVRLPLALPFLAKKLFSGPILRPEIAL